MPASAALTTTPGTPAHDLYASKGLECATCHPCGARASHPVTWMDPASLSFHAADADRNIASCQACHGPALDGIGGSTAVSCAQCHGATWKTDCTTCHGGVDGTSGAPPKATWGNAADAVRVGTHTSHLQSTHALSRPVSCVVCHVVPTDALSAGHLDATTATVTFSGLAAKDVPAPGPSWSRAPATCASTYCHGATLGGGTNKSPVWTATDGGARACNACHGAPPPAPHPANSDCGQCHPGYGPTTVNAATHIDGKLDVVDMNCTSCHGTTGVNAAPPLGTHGESATTARAVGAHQVHLSGGRSKPVACGECHVVPSTTSHSNGSVELVWGALSTSGGANPQWNGTTCASTYCHGATLGAGGSLETPTWTKVDGTQAACGTCHGAPPPAPHVSSSDCGACHAGYTATTVNAATHVDGKIDVNGMTCTSCHGTAGVNAAPPIGVNGDTATTSIAVGAHQAHLAGGTVSNPVACSECHVVPTTTNHANGSVDVTFGPLATTSGAVPSWDRTAATCASVYCHGRFVGGDVANAPSWTTVDGTQAVCGSCHGLPPAAPHVQSDRCEDCHTGYTRTTVDRAKHVNGTVDVIALTCTTCHGTAGVNAAPPVGTHGETATTARAVGAHQAHLAATRSNPVACLECHVIPTSMNHSNGSVELTWGTLARTGGANPQWDGATCAATYCHGATLNAGGTVTRPSWTIVNGTQDACGTCHGDPPPPPHVQNAACGSCHPGYTNTLVNAPIHVDGKVDVNPMTCSSCHGSAARTAIAGADANETAAPPADSAGNTSISSRGVGVHVAHVNQATYRSAPIACSECHFSAVPTSMTHSDGTVQFAFGALAKNASWGGVTPAPAWSGTTCASTYCHGAFKNGATATVTWTTAGALSCTSCHGSPPGGTHPANPSCGSCHTGYTATTVNKTTHMNGALDVTALTCTSCHGTAGQTATAASPLYAAPPVDSLGAATGLRVGAHQKHISGTAVTKAYSNGFSCQTCHATVGTYTPTHSNGAADVGFTGATPTAMAIGTFTAKSGTTASSCASTWCHAVKNYRGTSSGGTMQTPPWSASITSCTACHGVPPGTGHHSTHTGRASCADCHGTGYSSTAVNKTLHVNGVRNVGGTGTRINSWNASTRSCYPNCHGSETW